MELIDVWVYCDVDGVACGIGASAEEAKAAAGGIPGFAMHLIGEGCTSQAKRQILTALQVVA